MSMEQEMAPEGRCGGVLVVVCVGTFLTALAGSAVALALPSIGHELEIPLHLSSWVMQGFLLVVTALLLVAGRLGDLLGHSRVYVVGFLLFGAASALCGLAQSFSVLVGSRLVQGVGGALVMATGPALITTSFPAQRRGRALGMLASATYTGLTIGPPVGGFIIGSFGWRWIFLLNVPIALVVTGLGLSLLPWVRVRRGLRLDAAGTAAILLGLPLLMVALTQGRSWGWASWPTVGTVTGAVALLGAFARLELSHEDPLLDLGLFRSPVFSGAVLSAVCNYVALFIPVLLLPFYLTEGLQLAPSGAGLVLSVQPLVMALVASPSGALSDLIGTRPLAMVGMLVMAAALLGLTSIGAQTAGIVAGLWLAVLGLGTGIFISPNSSALMGSAPPGQQGIAGGVLAVARNLGMLVGVAAGTALFNGNGGETGRLWQLSDYRALRVALSAAAAISALGALAVFLGRRPGRTAT